MTDLLEPPRGAMAASRAVSALTTPYLVAPAFIILAGLHFVQDPILLALYGGIAVGFTVCVPLAYADHLRRRGRVESIHIHERRARLAPLALTGVSSSVGLAALYLVGAPAGIMRLGVMLIVLAASVLVATLFLKVSGHVSAWTAGTTVVVMLWGLVLAPLFLGVIPIAWSRVVLGRHDYPELVAGFAYGLVVSASSAWLLGLT